MEVKNKEGFPLISKKELKPDISAADTLFKGLCEQAKRNKMIAKDSDKIRQALDNGKLDLEELLTKIRAEDYHAISKLSEKLNLQENLLIFLADNSLRPSYEVYAEQLKSFVNQERWWRGYCPICGSKPVMAELIGAETKKFLICSCCGYEWRFKRTKCPFCENEEPKAFKYFFTEKEGRAYRVETCAKCKKYIKTVDAEELNKEIFPSVEDIGTLYLDILAKKEGYTREVNPLGLNFGDL